MKQYKHEKESEAHVVSSAIFLHRPELLHIFFRFSEKLLDTEPKVFCPRPLIQYVCFDHQLFTHLCTITG